MFKVYTSYFARYKEIQTAGLMPVGIAVLPPEWHKGPNLFYLAPRIDMLKMPKDKYDIEFNTILRNLEFRKVQVKSDLIRLQEYFKKDIVLMCFEKDWNECHRKLVAEWLNKKYSLDVTEWNMKEEKAKVNVEQKSLF